MNETNNSRVTSRSSCTHGPSRAASPAHLPSPPLHAPPAVTLVYIHTHLPPAAHCDLMSQTPCVWHRAEGTSPERGAGPWSSLQHPSAGAASVTPLLHTPRKQPVSTHINPLLFISCTAVYSPSQLSNPITYFITVFFSHVGFLK